MRLRLAILALLAIALAVGAFVWLRTPTPVNLLTAGNGRSVTVLDPAQPFALEPPPLGWRHRTFWLTPAMKLSFARVDGVPALRCETNAAGSIYGRFTDIDVGRLPLLVWRWRVEVPIPPGHDERVRAGDDHPVRWFVEFRDSERSPHRAEIIWSNGAFKRGEYKYIGSFPHYVADGGDANVGVWRDERADLEQIYRDISRRTDTPRLAFLAIFCDSDNTRTRSIAYTGETRLEAR